MKYRVAAQIGRTVAEVEDTLTLREFIGWLGYFAIEGEEQKKAIDNAKNKNKPQGGGVRIGRSRK